MGKHICESCGDSWNAEGYIYCPFCGSVNIKG